VRDEDAVLGRDRREDGVVEGEVGAAPQVEAPAQLDVLAERPALPGRAAHPVGGDDHVGIQVGRAAPGAEFQRHPGLLRVPLQDREQLGAGDADEAVVAHAHHSAAHAVHVQGHVVAPPRGDQVVQAVGVGGFQLALRARREPDAETEGRVGLALLVDGHRARGVGQLGQARGVEPARPAAHHRHLAHPHRNLPVRRHSRHYRIR
jgi:hypothetical protein